MPTPTTDMPTKPHTAGMAAMMISQSL